MPSKYLGASLVALTMWTSGCVTRAQYDRLVTEYHSENQARVQREAEVQAVQAEKLNLEDELRSREAQLAALQNARSASEERINELERALGEAQSRFTPGEGVEVFATRDGFAWRLQDKLLFDSGSTEIKEGGRKALNDIAKEILASGYKEVRIDGHTDSDPVVKTKEIYPLGNHELAAKRALSVFGYMVNQCKVPDDYLALGAFGPNQPVVEGSDTTAKARNRRVEIHVRVPSTADN